MLYNYFKTAVRVLRRNALFSMIDILGLAVGMSACLLILFYVNYEKKFDEFHRDKNRIYRLRYDRTSEEGQIVQFASCCPPAADALRGVFPELEGIGRIFRYRAIVSLNNQNIRFTEERMYFAEPEFIDIFDFKFLEGDPANGLRSANAAFFSESTAVKYFGNEDPVGKIFTIDGKTDYTVVGVFEDIPSNSHLKFDILLSYQNLTSLYGPDVLESWGHTGFYTYLKLKSGADPNKFENNLASLVNTHAGELMSYYKVLIELKMQPLTEIHLTSHFMQEYEINGNRESVNILLIVAFFIIFMAWINYINLSTSRSLTRARSVGLRKILGAFRRHLVAQFFLETTLLFLLAGLLACVLINVFLPLFVRITGMPPGITIWDSPRFWISLGALFLSGVLFSGYYPVMALAVFKPQVALKDNLVQKPTGLHMRKFLVGFQFVIALVLMTATLSVFKQIKYMKSGNLGFDIDQIMVVDTPRIQDESFRSSLGLFKEELLKHSNIKKLCVVTEVPGRQIYWDAGAIRRAGEDVGKGKNYQIVGIDYDFIDVFSLNLLYGRNFSKDFPADESSLILNESAVKWMGFTSNEDAIGQSVDYWGEIFTVIGVLEDYHQQFLKQQFEPHLYRLLPYGRGERGRFAIKTGSPDDQNIIQMVGQSYEKLFPGNPFEYFFLEDYYNMQYKADELLGKVIGIFSFLSILVTSLGIFAMSFLMSLQRTREFGIRKILGATPGSLSIILVKEFLVIIGVSFLVSTPLAFWAVSQWLNAFANRMSWNVWLFLYPLILVSAVTLITMSFNILKVARVNPITTIKHE
ncbi:MAG: ABC transporter permease [Candidatus Aminicenantes bacterium]|nr:ABC transporter permease [Candidatus Aminicenantes bacterium]